MVNWLCKTRLKAFSLVELSFVLIIVGILMGAVLKGHSLIEGAKIRAVIQDFHSIQMATHTYQETYSYLPGDDPSAQQRFGGNIGSGNGNGIIDENEKKLFWKHVYAANMYASDTAPSSKLGGQFEIVNEPHPTLKGHWIRLGALLNDKAEGALLTPHQVQQLMSKIDSGSSATNPTQGQLRAFEGAGVPLGKCVSSDHLNLETKTPACVVYMQLQ